MALSLGDRLQRFPNRTDVDRSHQVHRGLHGPDPSPCKRERERVKSVAIEREGRVGGSFGGGGVTVFGDGFDRRG